MPISTIGSNSLNQTSDLTINGQTVGKGGGNVATNTAHGVSALGNASNTGANNAAFGSNVLGVNTSGGVNAGFGINSLAANTTGGNNAGFGVASLSANTTGSYNVACGQAALQNNTTASNNTAVGYQAGYTNATGASQTFIGYLAGRTSNPSSGGQNIGVGNAALYSLTTGTSNTAIGPTSGYDITTGSKNTIIGGYTGNQGGFDIRTSSNYIVLSDGDGNPRAWIGAGNNNDLFRVGTTDTSTPGFMHQIAYSQTSRAVLGVTNLLSGGNPSGLAIAYPNSGNTSGSDTYLSCSNNAGARAYIKNDGGLANYSGNNQNLSDRREKQDFEPSKPYLETICAIPVQTFNYIDQADDIKTLGVVAQDVQAVAPELVAEYNWGSKEDPRMRLSVYQTDLQYALMKSIQELKAIVDAQAAEIAELKAKVA
jgi:trimeric autotransporter adhesin